MAKPVIVEDADLSHLVKIIRATSCNSLRNIALIYTLFGTGMKPSEIASLKISDYLDKNGQPKKDTVIRAEISFNGRERPLMWVNKQIVSSINEYLSKSNKENKERYLFLSNTGEGFTAAGLTNLLNKLIAGAGLEGCNTNSARHTLAVKLHRNHIDLATINKILGQSSLTATKKMCQGDTARLSSLVENII